jgi:hypothetical protein
LPGSSPRKWSPILQSVVQIKAARPSPLSPCVMNDSVFDILGELDHLVLRWNC